MKSFLISLCLLFKPSIVLRPKWRRVPCRLQPAGSPVFFALLIAVPLLSVQPKGHAQVTATLTTLYNFSGSDGSFPEGLVAGSDGSFYGTTHYGGAYRSGSVFRITRSGVLTTLYSFSGSDGQFPNALVKGSDGNFYGTTYDGGANYINGDGGSGTVFRITPAGVLTTLHSFGSTFSDGVNPAAALIQGSDGNFYGTTYQ